MNAASKLLHDKLLTPIRHQLMQGTSPHLLAASCTLGVALGIFPLMGTTTLLCLIFGIALRLNQIAIQAVNYIVYPVHLACIPLFIAMGARITGSEPVHISPKEVAGQFFTDIPGFLHKYGMIGLHAVFAWAIVIPFIAAAVYFVCLAAFRRWETIAAQKKTGQA